MGCSLDILPFLQGGEDVKRELAQIGVPEVILREAMVLHTSHVHRTRRVISMIREHAGQAHGRRMAKLVAEPPEHI